MEESYLDEEIERKRILTEQILAQINTWNNMLKELDMPLRVELNFLNKEF